MLTPPTTTAATTWSVTPVAAVALMVPNSMPHMMPGDPASRPHMANTANDDDRRTGCRGSRAASGLLPTA